MSLRCPFGAIEAVVGNAAKQSCSGSPNSNRDFVQLFASDIEPNVKCFLMENFKHARFYDDVTARDNRETPQVEARCFPCKGYSL